MSLNQIVFFLLLSLSTLLPKTVSEDVAFSVARSLFLERSNAPIDVFEVESFNIISEGNKDLIYVFHLKPSGFILVSADDVGVPVLGYSFENNFPMENWPDPLNYLISTFKEEIIANSNDSEYINEYVADEWIKYMGPIDRSVEIRNVAPLMTARWNQDNPWNGQCPEDSMGPGGRVYAGCVAVSMVQIMYYWRFPNSGSGSHGYYSNYGYLSVDYSDQTYDYNLMSDNIGTDEAQKIMYHAGIGVEMGYAPDGSGAWVGYGNRNAMTVMRDHFYYDNSISYVDKSEMSNTQYRSLIKNEIDNNRPLISRGCSNDGCHAWNLDGYEGDNIHSNFGWGGSSNGFYSLSSMGGFSSSQGVVYSIIPSSLDGPNLAMDDYELLESDGDFDNVLNPGETFELLIDISSLEPWNNASNINLSLSSDDEDIVIENSNYFINSLESGASVSGIPFTLDVDDDAEIKIHHLELLISAEGVNDAYFEKAYDVSFNVSLNQANFPFIAESQNGSLSGYTVEGSPIVLDINNDGIYEIFFGDYGGRIFGIDFYGEILPGFPIYLSDEGSSINQIWGAPAASDIDNDGTVELVFTSKNKKCYIVDVYGNIEAEYDSSQFLMGTPSIVELDGDPFKEIVFGGYSTNGKVFAINHDGSDVENFPVEINQKILRGFAIADFDSNGLSDMAVGTESGELFLVYDSGSFQSVLQVSDKFKSEPTILDDGEFLSIYIGNDNGIMYRVIPGIEGYDELVTADSKIKSSVSVGVIDNNSVLLFGANDKFLYAVDSEGNALDNWPVSLESPAQSISSVFSDLDGDGVNEIIAGSSSEEIYVFHADGTPYAHFPMKVGNGITSTPLVLDGDMDGDLDIVFGTNSGIAVIDIKDKDGIDSDSWSMFRGNTERDGCRFFASAAQSGDLNDDSIVNILDVVILVDIVINNQSEVVADLNSDGSVDVLDVVILVSTIING